MADPMDDFNTPFNPDDTDMPAFDDFSNFDIADLNFNEADFAGLDDGSWQNFDLNQYGFVINNDDGVANATNQVQPAFDTPNADFVAEVMAGVEQGSIDNDHAVASWENLEATLVNRDSEENGVASQERVQIDTGHELPSPEQPADSVEDQDQHMVIEALQSPATNGNDEVPISEQSNMPADDMDAVTGTEDGLRSPPIGCKAPPGTPISIEKQLSGKPLEAPLVRQGPAMPVFSSVPTEEAISVYQSMTTPTANNGAPAARSRQQVDSPQLDLPARTHPSISYQRRYGDFNAARQAITRPDDSEVLVKLPLDTEDDWQLVLKQELHGLAAQLYDAIQAGPGEPPENFTLFQRDYYYEHQSKVLSHIKEAIIAKPAEAEARVLLVFEELVNLHEHGLPESALRGKAAAASNFVVEVSFTCSVRAEKIIEAARVDKYVAQDILAGINLTHIIRSPSKYLERKRGNCRVNAKKAENHRLATQGKAIPVTARGRRTAANGTPAARRMQAVTPEASRAASPVAATAMPMFAPRAGPVPRIKTTLKRKVVDESSQAVAKRMKHSDRDKEIGNT